MKNWQLVVEKSDDHFWGWVESKSNFLPTGQGATVEKLKDNIKECVADYLAHEGKNDTYWSKVDFDQAFSIIKFNIESFFEEFDFIDLSVLAAKARIKRDLLEQFRKGEKQATELQAKKIEHAIHQLAIPMVKFKLVD